MNTILSAFESNGAPSPTVQTARDRLVEFDEMVETHVGDRSTLQLVLASNAPARVPTENLHNTRKMGYQCNSSIWGIQARVRMASFFLAPNPENPEMLDTASMGGLIDVRRLRSIICVVDRENGAAGEGRVNFGRWSWVKHAATVSREPPDVSASRQAERLEPARIARSCSSSHESTTEGKCRRR